MKRQPKSIRCAIYTRKSSEEGLEQDFNSLAAQREACAAYILSQAGEGWVCVPNEYDDGGFSGGNMERPGLKALLDDVASGHVDIVVVYKVDRLTRSITDFGRIVETLDNAGVSFVSITQAFNTTTSMGRLTLNVLLSFAQFEREVTGERIRDKIAASKAKGMYMGGNPPLGYDPIDRKLVINPEEAEVVRRIFALYIEHKSAAVVHDQLKEEGITSKRWQSRQGTWRGGGPMGRGALMALLKNPVYIGKITHKGAVHEGQHDAILDLETFGRARRIMRVNAGARAAVSAASYEANPLKGKLFDACGNPMAPSFSSKKNGTRYRYYVSAPLITGGKLKAGVLGRIGADEIERCVVSALPQDKTIKDLVRVVLTKTDVEIEIRGRAELITLPSPALKRTASTSGVSLDASLKPDQPWIKAVARSHDWRRQLEKGEVTSISEIASALGVSDRYIAQLIPLGWMAPDLIEGIIDGTIRPAIPLRYLKSHAFPKDWDQQRGLIAPYQDR